MQVLVSEVLAETSVTNQGPPKVLKFYLIIKFQSHGVKEGRWRNCCYLSVTAQILTACPLLPVARNLTPKAHFQGEALS